MENVAVMSVQYVQYTFPYYLDSMEKCGLRKVDLWGGAPHYCRLNYNSSLEAEARVRELRSMLQERGMEAVMYTPETLGYPFSYSTPDPALRGRTIDYMRAAMEDALALGTDRVFLNTGCHSRDLSREEGWKRTVDSYHALCDTAEKLGVHLILEQLQPYESDLCTTLADIQRMLREVGSPQLKCCVDLVAMEAAGESLDDYFHALGRDVAWIHYSDSHHMILGQGNFGDAKLEGYVRTMEQNDYQGDLDLEINDSIYWEDPHASLAASVDYLRAFLPQKP